MPGMGPDHPACPSTPIGPHPGSHPIHPSHSTALAPCLGLCKGARPRQPMPASVPPDGEGMSFLHEGHPALVCPRRPGLPFFPSRSLHRRRCRTSLPLLVLECPFAWFTLVTLSHPLFPSRHPPPPPKGVNFTRLAVAVLSFFLILFPYPPYVHYTSPDSLIDAGLLYLPCAAVVRLACLPPLTCTRRNNTVRSGHSSDNRPLLEPPPTTHYAAIET